MLFTLTSAPAEAADPQGFLYGKVTTRSGSTYEGRLRWGKEEAFWGDHFNSTKEERPYLSEVPRDDRRRREPIEIFGVTVGVRWRDVGDGRQTTIRYGDMRRIEVGRGDEAVIVLKSGTELEVDGGSNDLGGKIVAWDGEIGEIEIRWERIETVEFMATPSNLKVNVQRLYGKVATREGDFEGFIQWDQDECLSSDKLDGDSRDGDVSIEMGKIRTIERRSSSSSLVVLKSGRELVLDDSNDVDDGNRGIFVDDPRYGRVLVDWDDFEQVDFEEPPGSGPAYGDFKASGALRGTVTDTEGRTYRGRIVYDLDESEGWEVLDGKRDDLEFSIPLQMVASIAPESDDSSLIVLKNGEKLELEDTADVGEGNDGILVLATEGDPAYIPWKELRRLEFE